MSDLNNNINKILEILPNFIQKIPTTQDKNFLFFFPPQIVDNKFLFGLTFKTGVQLFAIFTFIQAIGSFFDIFKPSNFWLFIVAILAFGVYCIVALYAFLSTIRQNFTYARVSYLIIAALFLIMAVRYIGKSVVKIIDFVTPWDGDFLRLDFLIYIFGYGFYLFIYLYFIYILYRYMIELKGNSSEENQNQNMEINNNDEEININEDKLL